MDKNTPKQKQGYCLWRTSPDEGLNDSELHNIDESFALWAMGESPKKKSFLYTLLFIVGLQK